MKSKGDRRKFMEQAIVVSGSIVQCKFSPRDTFRDILSWERVFQAVKGWTATPNLIDIIGHKVLVNLSITSNSGSVELSASLWSGRAACTRCLLYSQLAGASNPSRPVIYRELFIANFRSVYGEEDCRGSPRGCPDRACAMMVIGLRPI